MDSGEDGVWEEAVGTAEDAVQMTWPVTGPIMTGWGFEFPYHKGTLTTIVKASYLCNGSPNLTDCPAEATVGENWILYFTPPPGVACTLNKFTGSIAGIKMPVWIHGVQFSKDGTAPQKTWKGPGDPIISFPALPVDVGASHVFIMQVQGVGPFHVIPKIHLGEQLVLKAVLDCGALPVGQDIEIGFVDALMYEYNFGERSWGNVLLSAVGGKFFLKNVLLADGQLAYLSFAGAVGPGGAVGLATNPFGFTVLTRHH